VTDTFPAALTVNSWTCTAPAGFICAATGSGNARTGTLDLPSGASGTFTASVTVNASAAIGSLVNTATVAPPAGTNDPILSNNSATDTDQIVPVRPVLTVLDNFNRGNANNLGGNWSQASLFGLAAITVNNNQASDPTLPGNALWNVPAAGFGARQAASFAIANATFNGDSLLLKGTGAVNALTALPANFVRVRISGATVVVETTTNNGGAYVTAGTLAGTFASPNVLEALVDANGLVSVWRDSTYLGSVQLPSNQPRWTTDGGRIGIQLPAGARVDDFAGGTVP
jgi:hypothetical protein